MPPLSEEELEERLSEAASSLLQPPSSSDELLPLLDRVEELLTKVEQSPAESLRNALSPLMNALVTKELLKRSDIDVKVGIASCISEITRITAPDIPYDDGKMKDAFQLIVSSFENLSDTSSRSFEKRTSILETVAKVRSCVIMLDLEFDQMIIDMFNHFLKAIRECHEEAIFMSMVTIMTIVLEESEDISPDLLSTILVTLKKNNEGVLPISKKLAERVIHDCAEKLKPYLTQTLKALNVSLDDYSEVVASTCEVDPVTCRHIDENFSKDQKMAVDGAEETTLQDEGTSVSPTLIESNGVNDMVNEEIMTGANYSTKSDSNQQSDDLDAQKPMKEDKVARVTKGKGRSPNSNRRPDDLNAQESINLEAKVAQVSKRKGRSPNSKKLSTEYSGFLDDKKQTEQVSSCQEIPGEDGLLNDGLDVEESKSLDDVKVSSVQASQSGSRGNEDAILAFPIESAKIPNENQFKKAGRPNRKGKLDKEETASNDCASEKASEGADVLEANNLFLKKKSSKIINEDKSVTEEFSTKNNVVDTGDSETKLQGQTLRMADSCNKMEDESLTKKRRGKNTVQTMTNVGEKEDVVASPKSPVKSTKYEGYPEETPRMKSKIKKSPGTDKTSETTEYDENLVDSKIRVWWPKDQMFYEGVIAAFDSVKKKHMVLYSDGDKEVLNLRRERWEFIGDNAVSDVGQTMEHSGHGASSNLKRKNKGDVNLETPSKHRKISGSPKSESKSSGKLKDARTKYSGKSGGNVKSGGKADSKSNGKLKWSRKSEAEDEDNSPRPRVKSRDIDAGKTSTPSKQESQQPLKAKGGPKPRANGTEIAKSSLPKLKETNQPKQKAPDIGKSEEILKGKSPDSAQSQGNATVSRKKRSRR